MSLFPVFFSSSSYAVQDLEFIEVCNCIANMLVDESLAARRFLMYASFIHFISYPFCALVSCLYYRGSF